MEVQIYKINKCNDLFRTFVPLMKRRTRQCLKDEHDKELNGLKFVALLNMLLMCA